MAYNVRIFNQRCEASGLFINVLTCPAQYVQMAATTTIPLQRTCIAAIRPACRQRQSPSIYCCLHNTPSKSANPLPVTAHGPAPKAPLPAVTQIEDRIARRRKQAELLQQGKQIRAAEKKPSGVLRKRFWKDVHIREVPGT